MTPQEQFQLLREKAAFFSPQLRAIVGTHQGTRSFVLRRIWYYVRHQNLFVPGEESFFLPDDLLKPVFGENKVAVFAMSKYLARHIF